MGMDGAVTQYNVLNATQLYTHNPTFYIFYHSTKKGSSWSLYWSLTSAPLCTLTFFFFSLFLIHTLENMAAKNSWPKTALLFSRNQPHWVWLSQLLLANSHASSAAALVQCSPWPLGQRHLIQTSFQKCWCVVLGVRWKRERKVYWANKRNLIKSFNGSPSLPSRALTK